MFFLYGIIPSSSYFAYSEKAAHKNNSDYLFSQTSYPKLFWQSNENLPTSLKFLLHFSHFFAVLVYNSYNTTHAPTLDLPEAAHLVHPLILLKTRFLSYCTCSFSHFVRNSSANLLKLSKELKIVS